MNEAIKEARDAREDIERFLVRAKKEQLQGNDPIVLDKLLECYKKMRAFKDKYPDSPEPPVMPQIPSLKDAQVKVN